MEITKQTINDIPITTYNINNNKRKPLIFFFHGFTSNKDDGIMGRGEKLAKLGYYVVAIDAYLHGSRTTNDFSKLDNEDKYRYIVDVEIQTAKDALNLWEEHFKKDKDVLPDYFFSYGVSMGAAITFYLATLTDNLKAIVTLVGSPSFYEYYTERANKYKWIKDDIYYNRLNKYKEIDPIINYTNFSNNTKIWMGLGINDEVVNPKYSRQLKEKLKSQVIKEEYNTAHESTDEMLNDSYEFLKTFTKEE